MGRHQNPWKECWISKMKKDGIKLARRRSGGGAVYQDLGNSCFTFINPIHKGELALDTAKKVNNKILLKALKNLGIEAEVSGRNDILCDGSKISGSAYKVNLGKNRTLHHGTMLLHIDLGALANYLNPSKPKLKSKGVDSVVKRVMNLQEISPDLNHAALCSEIETEFMAHYSNSIVHREILSLGKLAQIEKIKNTYNELKSDDWLYVQTPEFTNQYENQFIWGGMDFYVEVKNGMITNGRVYSDCLYPDFIDFVNKLLAEGGFRYNSEGKTAFCHKLREKFTEEPISGYVDDLEKWILTVD